MGLAGARNSAVTGLQAQSTNIAITSDNIANASTVGYKAITGSFSTLITSTGGSTSFSSGGVSISPQTLVSQQGLIQSTGNATDLAISGAGFFAVQDSAGTLLLTRAGSFNVNNKGELTNAAGFKLLGWPLDNDGRLPGSVGNANNTASESVDSLVVVDTDAASGSASATSNIKVGMNLNSAQSVYQGATITLQPNSSGNTTIAQGDVIVPGPGMQEGDAFTFTSNGATSTFEYGGFAKTKDITQSATYGSSSISTTFTTVGGDLAEGDKFTINTVSSGTVTFTFKQSSPDTNNGQFNSLSTLATAINSTNGLTARIYNGQIFISSDIANEAITFTDVSGSNMVSELGLSNEAVAPIGVNRFNTMAGLSKIVNAQPQLSSTIKNPTSGTQLNIFSSDPLQTLTLTKVKNSLTIDLQSDNNGLNTANDLIAPVEVDGVSTMKPEITGGTDSAAATVSFSDGTNTGTFTYGGIGGTKDITASSIFGATAPTGVFAVGGGLVSGTTLTFTESNITTGVSNTVTLQYLNPPIAATDFNSLSTLATALNANSNFIAKVNNGKLYVASENNANNLVNVTGGGAGGPITGAQIAAAFGGDFASAGAGSQTANIVQPAGTGSSKDITATGTGANIFGATTSATPFTSGITGLDNNATLTFTDVNSTNAYNVRYVAVSPNALASPPEFNTLSGLVTALNTLGAADLTASINATTGRLSVVSTFGGGLINVTTNGATPIASFVGATSGTTTITSVASSLTGGDTITFTEDASGTPHTVTVRFVRTAPTVGASPSEFNSLDGLVASLNTNPNFHARVVDGKLYVESANGLNKSVAITGTTGTVTLADIASAASGLGGDFAISGAITSGTTHTQRFANQAQLTSLIDGITNFSASDSVGENAATSIATDTAVQITVGGANNSDLLKELGITSGTVGNGFFTELGIDDTVASTASNAVAGEASANVDVTYNPDDATKNMAGGNVTPHFSRNIRIYDALGTGHDFRMGFVKTGVNKWAVELFSLTPSELTNDTNGDGLLVSGTLTFNGDGSLSTLSSTLTNMVNINWTGGSSATAFSFNLGTAGLPSGTVGASVIGLTDGVRQFDSAYNVDFVEQNGVSAGQFNGITVDEEGIVSAKFSNGQIKAIYKIPIITVANPNALEQKTGNVFSVTSASGDVNLKQAGLGGSGVIVPDALEGSTADIATELTKTIGIQANYNANATLISTVKAMEEELNRRL